ncbi:UNVERIFIED_CONTAM: TetR family transcriptional regulator [Murimonas intestini]|uniref:TetR family transcriptional regulator n=2 Tax=Murimonas intestini TaxID=1337051 RepID=A0AB73T674_9FIRM
MCTCHPGRKEGNMYEKFHELPVEKQTCIINAAMEVFSKNEYKQANTDDIAARAGISKGSLFYYFHNKRDLYLYLYDYTANVMKSQILDKDFWKITDLFERIRYGALCKVRILKKNPHILDFCVRCFYSKEEAVSSQLNSMNTELTDNAAESYFAGIDCSKFKDGVSAQKVYQMMNWMSDGYIHSKRMKEDALDLEQMMKEFEEWMEMLRTMMYKEEYLHECNRDT